MIARTLIAATLFSGLLLGTALPAYAQVTDRTDQSEEDWRKSRKKRGNTDIYRNTDPSKGASGVFGGGQVIEVSPVERLPSESRRHLMRERAKAIAESPDGDISDAEYVPSEEAKADPTLMQDEKEAWETIVTDLEGQGGQATTPSQGGPNKVAVVGRNGTAPAPGSRGGSTATLQEIMDAIKSGRMGTGSGGGNSDRGTTRQAGMGTPGGMGTGNGTGTGNAPQPGQGQGQGQSQGQGSGDGTGERPGGGPESGMQPPFGIGLPTPSLPMPRMPNPSLPTPEVGVGVGMGEDGIETVRVGETSTGLGVPITGGSAGQPGGFPSSGGAQGGQPGGSGDASSNGAPGDASGSSGDGTAAPGTGVTGQPSTPRTREDLSPLERIRRTREERDSGGSSSSASDYLGDE